MLLKKYITYLGRFLHWYIELSKPEYGKPFDRQKMNVALGFFEVLMKLSSIYAFYF